MVIFGYPYHRVTEARTKALFANGSAAVDRDHFGLVERLDADQGFAGDRHAAGGAGLRARF